MKMARLDALGKWRAIFAVLILSVVSAIAPPMIVVIIPPCFGTVSGKEAVLVAMVPAFVTILFGIVNSVSFSLGILYLGSKGKGGPGTEASSWD
jgi:hypothetical protein